MNKYLSKFAVVPGCQFGFQKGKGTCDAICTLTDYIYEKLYAKQHIIAVFLDLAKAYDTVNHTILLSKFYQYGFRDIILSWFRSYLSNRQHSVRLGNSISETACINVSIPQVGFGLHSFLPLFFGCGLCK